MSQQSQLAVELTRVVDPIVSATRQGPEGIVAFVDRTGIGEEVANEELEKIVSVLTEELIEPSETIVSVVETLASEDGGPPSLEEVTDLIDAIKTLIEGIQKLDDLSFEDAAVNDLGETVIDYLLIEYLSTYRPDVHNALVIVGVVKGSPPNEPGEIDLQGIPEAIQEPNTKATEVLEWGSEEAYNDLGAVPHLLDDLLWHHSIPSSVTRPEAEEVRGLTQVNDIGQLAGIEDPRDLESQLRIQLLTLPINNLRTVLGLKLMALPGEDGAKGPGFGLLPFGSANVSAGQSVSFGPDDDWTFSVDLSGATELSPYGLDIRPDAGGSLDPTLVDLDQDASVDASLEARAELSYDGSTEESAYTPIIGDREGTHVGVGQLAAALGVEYSHDDGGVTVLGEAPADGRIVIKPSGGFLEKVLPEEITADFETLVGWSSADGVYFEGGTNLEVPLPMHVQLGPITLKEVFLSVGLDPSTGAITTEASAAARVQLGPITGTVERMGVDAELSFPEDQDGNLGIVDLELGFKPPEGVGLSVDAGPVTGSGYVRYYPEDERYSGAAQLKISQLSITAVGVITTELPDGSDGFSMQVIVAGEFPAVQLGFGFTLTGIGGPLGINRQFKKKPLRKVVRKGNLDSVLFPERETVKNNPQRIISDIRSIFPPREDSYLFGPMVQLGYGTPAILKSSLGVILEIPSFRVAVVGRFELVLPNHEAKAPAGTPEEAPYPPVVLNLDVGGIIDIPGKSISIDASLYDSRLVQWSVSGDMALRANWGGNSRFILSVGGFNPRYKLPEDSSGLASLDRVKVSLDVPGGQPVVEFTGYFAVTSNTFQVGAAVYAELSVGQFKIWGELGFDALFQFKPFKFVFDFLARFMIEAPSFKMGFELDGTIKGPQPLEIDGTVTLTVGPVEVSAKIDVELGDGGGGEELPPAEVFPELKAALRHDKNWDATRPTEATSLVSLRGPEPDSEDAESAENTGPLRAHPLGTLTVTQSVVPLEYTIEKFGEATPKTYDRFRIDAVRVGGEPRSTRDPVDEEFAPAQFKKMDTSEKLDSPDFVEKRSGTRVGSDAAFVGGDDSASNNATTARFVYEEHLYDESEDVRGERLADLAPAEAGFSHTDHVAGSVARGKKGPSDGTNGRFSVSDADPGQPADDGSDGGSEGGAFVIQDPPYEVVEVEGFQPVSFTGGEDGSDDGGSEGGALSGFRKEEAKDASTEFARQAGRDESDLAVVPEHRLEGNS